MTRTKVPAPSVEQSSITRNERRRDVVGIEIDGEGSIRGIGANGRLRLLVRDTKLYLPLGEELDSPGDWDSRFDAGPKVLLDLRRESHSTEHNGTKSPRELELKATRCGVPACNLVPVRLARFAGEQRISCTTTTPLTELPLAQELAPTEAVSGLALEFRLNLRKARFSLAGRGGIPAPLGRVFVVLLAISFECDQSVANIRALFLESFPPTLDSANRIGPAPGIVTGQHPHLPADFAFGPCSVVHLLV